MSKLFCRLGFAALSAALILGCSNTPVQVSEGGGSEVEITGKLDYPNGMPATGVQVYLRPADYLPNISAKISESFSLRTLDSTFTDSLGNFSFDGIAAGMYTLECLDGEDGNGALLDSVVVSHPDSTIELATDTLKPLGSIAGQIQLPESLSASQIRVMVYGLDRLIIPDSTGDYVISGLAEGAYTLRIQILGNQGMDAESIVVVSDSTTRPPKAVLPGSKTICAAKATGPITLDGVFNEADWNKALAIQFSKPAVTENIVTIKTLWDSANLYFAWTVYDTSVDPSALQPTFTNVDVAEIFLDPNHDPDTIMNTDDLQFILNLLNAHDTKRDNSPITDTFYSAIGITGTGYNFEIAIPWTLIGKSPVVGLTMGAFFGCGEKDGPVALQIDWFDLIGTVPPTPRGIWKIPNLWGDLVLGQ